MSMTAHRTTTEARNPAARTKAGLRTALLGGMVGAFLALAPIAPLSAQQTDPQSAPTGKEDNGETFRMLELFGEVFERIRDDYVEEISDKELVEAAIRGMMRDLDPHSAYMSPETFQAMQTNTRGEFGGLGIEVSMDESGFVRVVSPIDDTPAAEAGLEAGDLITHLDGEPVQGLTLNEAVELMRGPIGEDIKLTILRESLDPFEVTITRDRIQIQSVRNRVEGDIGYIRITSFSGQTQEGLEHAIARIEEELGGEVKGYVLDLRNNPGGLLDQAISVSDTFLKQGEIVSTRGRDPERIDRWQASNGDMIDGLPLVVLINGGSASASEIVAGALQDHGRGIILGTKSFGKGSVQSIMPMNRNGSAIKLTTQRYYTPSGRSIQARGIDPDILVEQARLEVIGRDGLRSEADLRGALENEDGTPRRLPQEPQEPQEPPESQSDGDASPRDGDADEEAADASGGDGLQDYQLARALDLIRGIALYRAQTAN